jgi:hypothetical protein
LLAELPRLKTAYPALILPDDNGKAFAESPRNPATCTFSRISVNCSADLRTRIEPCFFGGNPDCSQCGCAVSAALHWLHERPLALGLKYGTVMDWTIAVGRLSRKSG